MTPNYLELFFHQRGTKTFHDVTGEQPNCRIIQSVVTLTSMLLMSWCQTGLTSDSEEVTDLPDFTVCLETGAAVKCESTKVKNKAERLIETLKHHVITSCLCLQCQQHEALRLIYVTLCSFSGLMQFPTAR